MVTEHTVRTFSSELKALDQSIDAMGKLVIAQIGDALKAIAQRDLEMARTVVLKDRTVDELEHEVDRMTVRLLALRQPVALDLRVIVAALRVAIDLERIADYAANVARRVEDLNQVPLEEPIGQIVRMGEHAREMLGDVLRAYLDRDADLALQVWHRDDEMDRMYTSLLCTLRGYMTGDQHAVAPCSHLLLVAKCMERMGDHVTNIAEHVQFLVGGTSRHQMVSEDNALCTGE